jgi:DNA-binding SARP family transcriptional activator
LSWKAETEVIEITTLGSFRVVIDGVDRAPSAGKPRTVLAMLAFHYNQFVSVDAIIDELWGANPPRTAMTTLQTYIWQIRKAFTNANQHLIETLPGGYLLRVPRDAMDIWLFEQLAADGRKAAVNGELCRATTLLDQALKCWRGQVISDIGTGERMRALKAYWHETRLSTWQLRSDLELRVGRHREMLGELTEMAATYPLDEEAAEQLMLALYRSGRKGDSLAAYQRIRQNLIGELGLEPSRPLRELHRRILESDPSLDYVSESYEAADRVDAIALAKPAQLPPAATAFVGREELLKVLGDALVPTGDPACVPTVSLIGPAGVGKSTLAIRLAHNVKDMFPDGQIYVDLGGGGHPLDQLDALNSMLFSLGIDPATLPGGLAVRASLFRSWGSARQLLIVLDNAANAEQVMPLLPNGPNCGVIVTCRSSLYGVPASHTETVAPLDEVQSMAVLAAVVPGPRVSQERDAAEAIIRECHGMPQLLGNFAAFIAAHPRIELSEALRMLRDCGMDHLLRAELG